LTLFPAFLGEGALHQLRYRAEGVGFFVIGRGGSRVQPW